MDCTNYSAKERHAIIHAVSFHPTSVSVNFIARLELMSLYIS